jgi:hypothetical protein
VFMARPKARTQFRSGNSRAQRKEFSWQIMFLR